MIKYNNNTINDWNFGDDNIIKVYKHGAVCYYKITSGDTPTPVQEPCFAVVDNISQYSYTEFEDVFNKADGKWYKLNNLNQYEQYGVYGSGRTITYYEGKLTIDNGYEYQYSGNSWVNVGEVSGSTATLPNVQFTVNYNAKNYNSSTKTLLKTRGQLADVDAVITAGTPTVNDGYLTIASGTRATISGYQNYFNRDNNNPNLTIISKQNTNGSNCHMFANRDSSYNWMYRCYNNKLTLHGTSEQGSVAVTTQPVIESVRVNSSRLATYNNYTNNTSSTYSSFNYGSTNSGKFALFAGYASSTGEWFVGDFYWVYMSQNTLTDEQVQQVIDYNEGSVTPTEYPMYYDEIQDPPDNVSFSSMTEAESYECPWWGMTAIIDNTDYLFCESNEWLTKYAYQEISGEYLCDSGNKYKKMQEYDRLVDGTMSATTNYVIGDLIESGSPDCVIACSYNFCGVDANGNTVTINNGTTTLTQSNWTSPYPVEGIVGAATTTIGMYCFNYIKGTLTALTIGNTVTTIEHEAFMETSLLTTLTIPSSVTQIDFWAFTRCNGLNEVIFEGTTPPTFTNQHSGVFHDYCPPVIYVPDSAVSAYRAIDGSVWTNQSWSTNIIQPISNRT
ncbi:MAG: leucine-rich repeat protein [Methanobrevibacter sp.]|nr:leucine-rich repeat protein [Methanobrevibacter sp.]